MTAQISDKFRYNKEEYKLAARTAPINFDPKDYGVIPSMSSTACWRGYWCEYVIKQNKLILEKLLLHTKDGVYPPFNGIDPLPQEYKEVEGLTPNFKKVKELVPINMGHRTYILNMELDYTGNLVLGKDLDERSYIHMGFQHPWAYHTLKEFKFENGQLLEIIDHSELANDIRKKEYEYSLYLYKLKKENPEEYEKIPRKTIEEFIDEMFSLNANVKAWWL